MSLLNDDFLGTNIWLKPMDWCFFCEGKGGFTFLKGSCGASSLKRLLLDPRVLDNLSSVHLSFGGKLLKDD